MLIETKTIEIRKELGGTAALASQPPKMSMIKDKTDMLSDRPYNNLGKWMK